MSIPRLSLAEIAAKIDYGLTASASKAQVGPKFLRITDIQNDAVDWNDVPFCEATQKKLAKARIKPGDIVFARTGATTGKSFLINNPPENAVFASYLIRVRPSDKAIPSYLAHFFRSQDYWSQINNRTRGAAQGGVNATSLGELEIPLPPLDEQRRIAGILDAADALRRRRREALALLDTLPGAIFAEMFGNGNDLEKVPMKELIEVRSSLADPTLPENAGLPHVGPEHILQGGGRIEWGRVQSCHEDGVTSGKYHFSAGDVIYSKIRPYLNKVAIADRPGMCSADMYALRPSSDRMTIRYLHFILGSAEFLSYGNRVSGRANIPKMNRKQLLAFDVPLPTTNQQNEFEKRLDTIDIERNKLVRQSSEIETLFASLQYRAFAGEL